MVASDFTKLLISKEEISDIVKIVKPFEKTEL